VFVQRVSALLEGSSGVIGQVGLDGCVELSTGLARQNLSARAPERFHRRRR
jgi:hypothetical protein